MRGMLRSLLVAAVLLSSSAFADLTLVSDVTSLGKHRVVTLSVKADKAFFDIVEDGAGRRGMLRDGVGKKLFLLDHEKKVVMVMTEEDSKALEARQEQFKAQMKAQLEKMPPEQRARMEQSMLGMMEPQKPPAYTYEKKKAPARKIAGFSCDDYTIKLEGKAVGEGCLTTWKAVGMTADEFKKAVLDAMPSSASAGPMLSAFEAQSTAPGFPVERTMFDDAGAVKSKTTLKSFTKSAMAAENFEVPKGYAEKSMKDLKGPPPPGAPAPAPAPSKP